MAAAPVTAYAVVRVITILLDMLAGSLFIYMDHRAWTLFRQRLLSRGEFIGKVARVVFMFASANGSIIAVEASKPAGPFVIWIFLGALLLAIAAVDQAHDMFIQRRATLKGNNDGA